MDFTRLEKLLIDNGFGAIDGLKIQQGSLPAPVKRPGQEVKFPSSIDLCALLLLAQALGDEPQFHRLYKPGQVTLIEAPSQDWLAPVTKIVAKTLSPYGRPTAIRRGTGLSDAAAQYGPTVLISQADPAYGSEFGFETDRAARGTESEAQSIVTAVAYRRAVIIIVAAGDRLDPRARRMCSQTVSMSFPGPELLGKLIHIFCRRHQPFALPALSKAITPTAIAFAFNANHGPKRAMTRLTQAMLQREPVPPSDIKRVEPDDLVGLEPFLDWARDLEADLKAMRHDGLDASALTKGALVVGPPGVGKTRAASAIGRRLGLTTVHGSVGRWLGTGGGHLGTFCIEVRKAFDLAAASTPSLLIIDEIDAIPPRRNNDDSTFWDAAVAALLEAIDGTNSTPGVIVVGLANSDNIDDALRRAGRLEHLIELKKPDVQQLAHNLQRLLSPELGSADMSALASRLIGGTIADVDRIAKDARRLARGRNEPVALSDVATIIDRRLPRQSERNRERTALHEAGHTLLAFGQGMRIDSVSLVSPLLNERTVGWLQTGFVEWLGTIEQVRCVVRMLLAGRAAEILVLGGSSMGAGADLRRATELLFDAFAGEGLGTSLRWRSTDRLKDIDLVPSLAREIDAELARCQAEVEQFLSLQRQCLLDLRDALLAREWLDELQQ